MHEVGTESHGIETKLTCGGRANSKDLPRSADNGETPATGTYTLFHEYGNTPNCDFTCKKKSPTYKKETTKSPI